MGCGGCGWKYRNLLTENMSCLGHLRLPVTFGSAINSVSDAGSFLPQVSPTFNEVWFDHRPEPLGIPAYTRNLQVAFSSGASTLHSCVIWPL